MATRSVLRMSFMNNQNRRVSVNLHDPVDNPDATDVGECMDKAIMGNIFNTCGGSLTAKIGAEVIDTTNTTIVDYT